MQNSEIELKFPVPDPEALQTRLTPLGFHLVTPRTFEHNTLYDTPNRDLRARKQILRLRQYGSLCTLTHKRLPDQQDPVDTTRYKIRVETETLVAEREAMAEIFKQLGYLPAFVYTRSTAPSGPTRQAQTPKSSLTSSSTRPPSAPMPSSKGRPPGSTRLLPHST